ncbi:MAG: hypothetical protein J5I47_06855 [Vicingus serpentipes]|nr:hypothetical protein [Vicingus serpentipes]
MKNKNNIPENPLKDAPFLSKIKKENHFLTPKNYFESLDEVRLDKYLNKNKLTIIFDNLSYRIFIPLAACVAIFILVFNYNLKTNKTSLTSEQVYETLVNEDYIEIEDDLLYETYYEVTQSSSPTLEENDEYIEYLIENDIDINLIIAEL